MNIKTVECYRRIDITRMTADEVLHHVAETRVAAELACRKKRGELQNPRLWCRRTTETVHYGYENGVGHPYADIQVEHDYDCDEDA